jgi:hypothetical protein
VPWLRRLVAGLSPRRPGFAPGSVHVGFVIDKVALAQVPSSSVFPCQCHSTVSVHYRIIWGMNDRPLTGRSSPHRLEQRNHYRCVMMALTMEAVCTSETSVCFYETTRRHVPEDPHPCLDMCTLLYLGTSSEQSLHLDFERT